MRVLVAGGAGYIGSVVSQHLIETGHTHKIINPIPFVTLKTGLSAPADELAWV